MIKIPNDKPFSLDERTYQFAKNVRFFCKKLEKITEVYPEYINQLLRSSSAVGANYIEANEALGKKDSLFRFRICRKEAKEACYWLRLIIATIDNESMEGKLLWQEAHELTKILSSIINNMKYKLGILN